MGYGLFRLAKSEFRKILRNVRRTQCFRAESMESVEANLQATCVQSPKYVSLLKWSTARYGEWIYEFTEVGEPYPDVACGLGLSVVGLRADAERQEFRPLGRFEFEEIAESKRAARE